MTAVPIDPIARLVVTMVLFLEQTAEEQLDLDHAVEIAEYLCPPLRALSYLSDGALVGALERTAAALEDEAAALARSLPAAFALALGGAFPEPVEVIEADRARARAADVDPLAASLARLVATHLLLLEGAGEEVIAPAAVAPAVRQLMQELRRLDRPALDQLIRAIAFVAPEFAADAARVAVIPTRFGLHAPPADDRRHDAPRGAHDLSDLARVYATAYLFLEQTGEARLDLNANVRLGEYLADELDHMEPGHWRELSVVFDSLAASRGGEEATIVRDIVESHGLLDRPDLSARSRTRLARQVALCAAAGIAPLAAQAARLVAIFTLSLERLDDEEIEPGVDDEGMRRLAATLHALPPASLAVLIAAFDVIAPDFTSDADEVGAIPRDFQLLEVLAGATPAVTAPATLRRARAGLPPRVAVPRQIG